MFLSKLRSVMSLEDEYDDINKFCSVIIPAYNAERTIARCLASLISNRDFIKEVIIVNDRSEDDTVECALEFEDMLPLQIIDNEGEHNPGAARKTGLLHATSEWVTFVDADDCLTANSLYYVYDYTDDDVAVIHTMSIFYESGEFTPDTVSQEDLSCGGNFYRRDYLIRHKLFPHPTLKLSEDEYFNQKIEKYITYCDDGDMEITYYDYPVYEVHHDIDEEQSYAISNWVEYLLHSHLQCQEYITDDFIKYKKMHDLLLDEYLCALVFGFYSLMSLLNDDDIEIDYDKQQSIFRYAIEHFERVFNMSRQDVIDFYNNNPEDCMSILEGVKESTGQDDIPVIIPFQTFINSL